MTGRLDQAEIVREMHAAHVLVLPSVFEGFGLVIAEAMATGMPVIASTHSAGPDLMREGRDGFVLEPDDVEGLAQRLETLRADRSGHRKWEFPRPSRPARFPGTSTRNASATFYATGRNRARPRSWPAVVSSTEHERAI